jgi:pseudouridine kinase
MISSVAVFGTIFMDCKGFANQKYNALGRNLGNIHFVHGGVGRNVAENLAKLQLPVLFVSTVDKTAIGAEVVDRLDKVGLDTKYLTGVDTHGMGMWLAVSDHNGDLAGSISQMPDLIMLEDVIARKGEKIVKKSTHIVLELDLNEQITRKVLSLAKTNAIPVYGIPGNLDIILKNQDILSDLACFICNDIEAERLLGVKFGDLTVEGMQRQLTSFVEQTGMGSMVITLGSKGSVYYSSKTKKAGFQPVFPVNLVDSSGAGDAFFSGTVMGLVRNRSLSQAVVYGSKVAAWTIQCNENNCVDLASRMKQDELFCDVLAGREKNVG